VIDFIQKPWFSSEWGVRTSKHKAADLEQEFCLCFENIENVLIRKLSEISNRTRKMVSMGRGNRKGTLPKEIPQ
jgi:hypothetical protein